MSSFARCTDGEGEVRFEAVITFTATSNKEAATFESDLRGFMDKYPDRKYGITDN